MVRGMTRHPAHDGRRFEPVLVEPGRSIGLRADHPAVAEGRTLFPSTVVSALQSPRLLVSGANNAKLGKVVQVGPWAGMPIYQVTLEERATCPRSCPVWADCYGNAMHLARRHDAHDPDLLVALWAEVVSLYRATMNERKPPPGLVVRLHVLGDFPSARYVAVWADLLDKLPGLRIFGYTARRDDADDQDSRETARAIADLQVAHPDRFCIRWSRPVPVPNGSVVVDQPPADPGVLLCPGQTDQTASCATCGLCWAPSVRHKAVAFLRHGIKGRGPAGDRPDGGFIPGEPGSDEWWERQGL